MLKQKQSAIQRQYSLKRQSVMMEMQEVRPKHRSRQRRARPVEIEQDEQNESEDTLIDELTEDVKRLDVRISDQEEELHSKRMNLEDGKHKTKQTVKDLFAELRHILETKERDTLNEIDQYYEENGFSVLNDFADKCSFDKQHVETMMNNNAEMIRNLSADNINRHLGDLKRGVIQRDNMVIKDIKPVITSDVKEILHQWNCVSFENDSSDHDALETGEVFQERDVSSNSETESREEGVDEHDCNVDGEIDNERIGANDAVEAPINMNLESETQPSAPSLAEVEEDPPPYWQAIGLSGPEAVVQPASVHAVADLNTRTYEDEASRYHEAPQSPQETMATGKPENSLENWHAFPSRRQFDHRSTLLVALNWNYGIICLGDRGNRKVKFFASSGSLISEITLNGEIHDVAFLERYNDESRYIVSLPTICTLTIISLKTDYSIKIVRNIALRNSTPYNCISRGPVDQTLVGGSGLPSHKPPCVDVISFNGSVAQTFKLTPNYTPFKYPKAVAVFSQFIIISDWSLNVVCVFSSNGSPVGEYSGTPTTPLIDPLDITLDHFGNILVLDGQFPNIHVMDLRCTPIEVLKIPRVSADNSSTKLLAFERDKKMLATTRSNGQIAVYSFHAGYRGVRQGEVRELVEERREPVVLPLIEGMLPSTIENMGSRQRPRTRSALYHL